MMDFREFRQYLERSIDNRIDEFIDEFIDKRNRDIHFDKELERMKGKKVVIDLDTQGANWQGDECSLDEGKAPLQKRMTRTQHKSYMDKLQRQLHQTDDTRDKMEVLEVA